MKELLTKLWGSVKWAAEYIYKNTLVKIYLSFGLGSIFFLLDENFGPSHDNALTYLWAFFYGVFVLIILIYIFAGLVINPIKMLIKKLKNR